MSTPVDPAPQTSRSASSGETAGPSTRDQLVVYLRNHDAALGAATARLELTARHHRHPSARQVLAGLVAEARMDRDALGRLMHALGIRPSRTQRMATRLGERLGRLKPNGSWSRRTPLTDVVELEALGLAALGTLRMWQTLLTWQTLEGIGPLTARVDDLDLTALVSTALRRVGTLERLHDESVRSLVHGGVDLDGHDGG